MDQRSLVRTRYSPFPLVDIVPHPAVRANYARAVSVLGLTPDPRYDPARPAPFPVLKTGAIPGMEQGYRMRSNTQQPP
jgi:hypothetical protein